MSSKGFESSVGDIIEFYHQVATIIINTLTILEFYTSLYKHSKMFYWVSTVEFSVKSYTHSSCIPQTAARYTRPYSLVVPG